MITGPDGSGKYDHIPHYLAHTWYQDLTLLAAVPATEDELTNRFYLFGTNRITDDELLNMVGSYVVVDDFNSSASVSGIARAGVWPHRVVVYGNSCSDASRLLERFVSLLRPCSTHLGMVCQWWSDSYRLWEAGNHGAASAIVQANFKA